MGAKIRNETAATKHLTARVTEGELDDVRRFARCAWMSVSDFVRLALTKEIEKRRRAVTRKSKRDTL